MDRLLFKKKKKGLISYKATDIFSSYEQKLGIKNIFICIFYTLKSAEGVSLQKIRSVPEKGMLFVM